MGHLNVDELNTKITKIFAVMNVLSDKSEAVQKKMIDIRKIVLKFQENKTLTLHQTNSYLQFQRDLLCNEKSYYDNMKGILLEKMSKEMIEIYDYIIMILTSLENLEIEHEEDKHNIIKKMVIFKNLETIDCSNIIQLINATVNNLELIHQFIELFNSYIEETSRRNSIDNIHCNNFNSTLYNKKNHITLEYNKYCEQLRDLIDYFLGCSEAIEKQKLLEFLVDKNEHRPSSG